jgi:hypothetical protein
MRNLHGKLRRTDWWTRTPLSEEELDRCLADLRSVLDDEPAFREQILRELFGKTGQRPPSGSGQPERCTAVVCVMSRRARQARRLASPAEHGQRRGCGRALPPGPRPAVRRGLDRWAQHGPDAALCRQPRRGDLQGHGGPSRVAPVGEPSSTSGSGRRGRGEVMADGGGNAVTSLGDGDAGCRVAGLPPGTWPQPRPSHRSAAACQVRSGLHELRRRHENMFGAELVRDLRGAQRTTGRAALSGVPTAGLQSTC